jgi:hypothetical protein
VSWKAALFVPPNRLPPLTPALSSSCRWGIRYILGEWLPKHHRPSQQAYEDAQAAGQPLPPYEPDLYLDGQLKRVFSAGRFDLLEVLGYGFPPN